MPDWGNIVFEHPQAFGLLILFLVGTFFFKMRTPSVIFPNLAIFRQTPGNRATWMNICKWTAIMFSIVALASPVIENRLERSQNEGYDIALLLDASVSMADQRFDPDNPTRNKFSVVQESAAAFLNKRESDNLALIVFGEYAFVASPLTFDKTVLLDILNRLSIGIAGRSTAINDAMALGIRVLKNSEAKSRIAILLTDGENTAGNIPQKIAIDLAKKDGIRIYTIGIGGKNDFDRFALETIANSTGGVFFHARNSRILNQVYAEIDRLERSEIKGEQFIKKEYFFAYPLILAFLGLLIYTYLRNQRGV